ncbi:uncharacterized protein LOC100889483 [Strongylocentrotus purpuratus]|uniref:Uncharacterized protein n=1 Tax=Strongylocentrotus purpuratus TaxID=7668 RepID=A0A7M7GHD3_STRPU|nr:uncharacterized protein LOC100889483 [Strongylocentrotus purpuratus]|eukprot:XP_003724213.1 PREDICTED: uncharacterized protein LOC100889483 [Strongylocentrotus purpuratus]
MAAVACNSLGGQLALSYSQPVLKSTFYHDIYTVKEEIDTNSNHIAKKNDISKQKSASLHRGTVRFVQLATANLSTTSDLSNSKDSGIGSSDDNNSQGENTITRDDEAPGDEAEDDEEHVKFTETARKYTNANVEKMTWKERGERMDNCLGWLREEITKMKKQDQSLMRQFMELRSTIHQLKQSSTQQSLRATYLRNQSSCANLGASDLSARSNTPHRQSHSQSRSSLRPLGATSQSSTSSNLSSMQFHSRGNLNHAHSNLSGNVKMGQSLAHLEDTSFDMDSYFGEVDFENDSFYDDDDSDAFVDLPDGMGGTPVSALSEQPYMPQYRTRTVSLVTPHYIGRPTASGYLARSRYMSFSNAKGRVESERAILE